MPLPRRAHTDSKHAGNKLFFGCCSVFCISVLFYIREWFIYNVVLVSDVQQSDSVLHIHTPILFQILLTYRLLQSTE